MAEKKARMTDRERVEALLRREKPDRVPLWPFGSAIGFCMIYTGTTIPPAVLLFGIIHSNGKYVFLIKIQVWR